MVRPTSLTVICWILIGISVLGIIGMAFSLRMLDRPEVQQALAQSPIPIPIQLALGVIGPLIIVAAAVLMLKGKVIGRTVYVGWNLISLTVAVLTSPFKMAIIPGAVLFAVVCAFLFRKSVSSYLANSSAQSI